MQYQIPAIIHCVKNLSQGGVDASVDNSVLRDAAYSPRERACVCTAAARARLNTQQGSKGGQSQPMDRNKINKSSWTNPAM